MNFSQIKAEIVSRGLATQEMTDVATQQVIVVEGEWNDDGTADITATKAGFVVGDFNKCVNASFDVVVTTNFDDAKIKSALQAQFPDAKVIVKIQ